MRAFQLGSFRCFMSPAFALENEWKSRLNSPIFQNLEMNKFFVDMDRKFQREKRSSHVDIDLFANKAQGDTQLEQLEELLHQFRRTPQTILNLPSTQFAVVRTFVEEGSTDNLLRLMDDRFNYGIFPDDYSLVYLLNHFLVRENWRDGAKVGIHMMIQEDHAIPIAREMALYACYMYLKHPVSDQVWAPQEVEPEAEPEDEIKIRVKYLEPEHFDDHFDLIRKEHQIGKTLTKLGATDPDLELLGLVYWEKWDLVRDRAQKGTFAAETIELIRNHVTSMETLENREDILKLLESVKSSESDVEARLKNAVTESVNQHESKYIETEKKNFEEWNRNREIALEKQYQAYQREAKKEEILRMKQSLEEKEEKLFFFEKKDELDKIKEEKEQAWSKTKPSRSWGRITLKPRKAVPKDYTPPEMGSRSSRDN